MIRFARTTITALPIALIAFAAGLDRPAAASDGLRVTPLPVTNRPLPSGDFQAVARFQAEALDAEGTEIRNFAFREINTTALAAYVIEAAIGVDTNGDGRWDAGIDELHPVIEVAGAPYNQALPAHNNGWVALNTGPGWLYPWSGPEWSGGNDALVEIPFGAPVELYVLYRLDPATPIDTVFQFDTNVPGWLWTSLEGTFNPFEHVGEYPEYTWEGLLITPQPLTSPIVTEGETGRPLAKMRLEAIGGSGAHRVGGLTFAQAAGNPTHITALQLVHDSNNNGEFDATDDVVDTSPIGFEGGPVTLNTGSAFAVFSTQAETLFLAADFANVLSDGMLYQARLESASGVVPGPGIGTTTLFDAITGYTDRDPTVYVSIASPASHAAGQPDRVAGSMIRLDAVDDSVTVQSLRVQPIGSALPGTHITELRLFSDVNANGLLDTADEELALAIFTAPEEQRDIVLGRTIASGGRLQLLTVWSMPNAEGVPSGTTLGIGVAAVQLSPTLPVIGLPLESPLTDIGFDGGNDPEFDTVVVPDPVLAGNPGCSARATSGAGLLATLLIGLAMLVAVRRR